MLRQALDAAAAQTAAAVNGEREPPQTRRGREVNETTPLTQRNDHDRMGSASAASSGPIGGSEITSVSANSSTGDDRPPTNTAQPQPASYGSTMLFDNGNTDGTSRLNSKPGGDPWSDDVSSDEDEWRSADDDQSDDDDEQSTSRPLTCYERLCATPVVGYVWTNTVYFVRLVANVENLWDDPYTNNWPGDGAVGQTMTHTTSNGSHPSRTLPAGALSSLRRKNYLIVLFWFVVLAASYAGERSTFKLLVDRSGPFRLFAVLMLVACHAALLAIGIVISHLTKQVTIRTLGIPVVDVALMALLDTLTLLLVFSTGYHVAPTLTVILIQFTLPLAALLTQFVHPRGRCSFNPQSVETPVALPDTQEDESNPPTPPPPPPSNNSSAADDGSLVLDGFGGLSATHVWGSLIIFAAVMLALVPALYSIAYPDFFRYADTIPLMTAYNTLLYVSSCIPQAASQLYKEHIFIEYKQPVNVDYLNLLISVFQLFFVSVLSPLVYELLGLGGESDWTSLYPGSEFSENFSDGLQCFFGMLDPSIQSDRYPDEARCRFCFGLVLLHTFSIIAVGVAVDKIIKAGATKVMYRGVSAGIILGVLIMHEYDMRLDDFNYGPLVDGLNLACLILLIVGSEVYHRVSLQEATFETVYPAVRGFEEDG
jgi:CRT-like, chloroquine-resistance transporter-like